MQILYSFIVCLYLQLWEEKQQKKLHTDTLFQTSSTMCCCVQDLQAFRYCFQLTWCCLRSHRTSFILPLQKIYFLHTHTVCLACYSEITALESLPLRFRELWKWAVFIHQWSIAGLASKQFKKTTSQNKMLFERTDKEICQLLYNFHIFLLHVINIKLEREQVKLLYFC